MQTEKFLELPQTATPPSLYQLTQEHSLYARRLEQLISKPYPSQSEQMEEIQLKKLKLRLKDEIERLRRSGVA